MKKLTTNEIWDDPKFITIKTGYQLIERYLFDKLADKIGVAYINQEFLEWRFKVAIADIEELLEAIRPWWDSFEQNDGNDDTVGRYFIRKDFITQTQGGAIYLTTAPHQTIFAEMVKHKKNGFADVVNAVRSANPELEVQTMAAAHKDYCQWDNFRESSSDANKSNGYKQNIDAFKKNERNFRYLGIKDFPPINDGFKLGHDDKNDDTPSPAQPPQPSSPEWQKQPNPNRR
jgi:hypothetical protein